MQTTLAPFKTEPGLDFTLPAEQQAFQAALESVRGKLGVTYPLWIDGKPVVHAETFSSVNPAHPDEIIAKHVVTRPEDVEAAIAAAEKTFPLWSATSIQERLTYMHRAVAELRRRRYELDALMVLELGKTWDEADGEVAEAIDLFEWYGRQSLKFEQPQKLTPSVGEDFSFFYIPLGVGAVIAPFNFPLALTIGMAWGAIVTGNTVVIKPTDSAATVVAWLFEIFNAIGLPAGVANLVTGPGIASGQQLVAHPRIRFIAFTGSKRAGVNIYESGAKLQPGQKWFKRIQMELGGKNAIIVDETADLDAAADGLIASAFGFQGQRCSSAERAVVVESVYDALLEKVVARAKKLKVADPVNADAQLGPLIDEIAQKKFFSYVELGKKEGKLVLGGGKPFETGYFVEPTIFSEVAPNARITQEEVFGPFLAFIRARDFDEALAIANATEYGLTGSVYSRDRSRLERARREFHVGNLYFNRKSTGALMGVAPFGGFNMSGTDTKAGGPDYLQFFLQGKTVGETL
ncbi:L-glutamate gamma-semialdehyde dehydrogenase [Candidatus Chlorohelix sp.]|uniref:L-glutamate gamma-semialdehyde dehydrogenase n=1 Tax=Candidatus Chlorohelix sp. TaxID=3139201 RepID=UPI00305961ED